MSLSSCIEDLRDVLPADMLAEIDALVKKGVNDTEIVNNIRFKAKEAFTETVETFRENGITVEENTELDEKHTTHTPPDNRAKLKGYYDPENTLIRLTQAGNLSTFMHEFAHFMLDMEVQAKGDYITDIKDFLKSQADTIAVKANATVEEVTDFIDNYDGASVEASPIETEVHEFFARSFERYLSEGKAAPKSKDAFRRMASWMNEVYSRMPLDSSMVNDQIRSVFDAMVKTEETVYESSLLHRYDYAFSWVEDKIRQRKERKQKNEGSDTETDEEGITQEQLDKIKKEHDTASEEARARLRRRLFEEIHKRERQGWLSELASIAEQQLALLMETKDYKAQRSLRAELQLNRESLKQYLPEGKIPRSLYGMSVLKGGVTIEDASASLGYRSPNELVRIMTTLPKVETLATQQATEMMEQKYGTLSDVVTKMVDEAMVSEKRAIALFSELKALRRGEQDISIDAIKELAAQAINKLTYRELSINSYRTKEINAAKKAAVNLYKGDLEEAATWKEIQLANHYLQIEARKRIKVYEKLLKRKKTFNKNSTLRKTLAKNEIAQFLEHYQNMLARIGLADPVKPDSVDMAEQEWYVQQSINGITVNPLLFEYSNTDLKDVPFNIMQGVLDALDSIYHVAKVDSKLTEAERGIKINAEIEDAIRVMQSRNKKVFNVADVLDQVDQDTTFLKSKWKGITKLFRSSAAQLTKIQWMQTWLDGGQRLGANYNLVAGRIYKAYNNKMRLNSQMLQPIADMVSGFSKETVDNHNKVFDIPPARSTDPVTGEVINKGLMTGAQLVSIVLQAGSKSGREKMIRGEGWGTDYSNNNPVIQFALRNITKEDHDFIQLVWSTMEQLQKPFFNVHRRVTGKKLVKVEAEPISTPFGELTGGYYPVVYDTKRGGKTTEAFRKKIEELTDREFSGFDELIDITNSATHNRTEFAAPINFSLNVIDGHLSKVIHYTALREAVRDVNMVVTDSRYKRAVIETLGEEHYNLYKGWLRDIAREGNYIDTTPVEDVIHYFNGSLTITYMGYKLSTFFLQLLGLSVSAAEVGSKNMIGAIAEIATSEEKMSDTWKWIKSVSPVMANRLHTMDRELQNSIRLYAKGDNFIDKARRHAMTHIAYMQTFIVDFPTWLAAYNKGLDMFEGSEEKAINHADFVVEQTQGSGSIHNMGKIFRNQKPTHQMYTLFMTFFSAQLMSERDIVRGIRNKHYSPFEAVRRTMLLLAVPTAIEMLVKGEFDDEDDDKNSTLQFAANTASLALAGMPLLRNVADFATSNRPLSITPLASEMSRTLPAVTTGISNYVNGEEVTDYQMRSLIKMFGIGFRIPGGSQASILLKNYQDGDPNVYHNVFPVYEN